MWNWLRKPKKSNSLGALVDDMKQRGYQGPFANSCDGRLYIMFHGPKVSFDPKWLKSSDNSFQMRVIDNAEFCSETFLYDCGNNANAILDNVAIDRDRLRESFCDPHVEFCLLGYPISPGEIPEGPHAVAKEGEDLWNIFLFDGYFYFTRSLSGQLRHRAKVKFHDHAMFVTEVATNLQATRNSVWPDAYSNDRCFGVRQVDFLIKALLLNLPCPAPMPNTAPTGAGVLGLQAFNEYGRIGRYPTYEDTTEYRICLNGSHGRFSTNSDNLPLVNAITAFNEGNCQDRHQRLHEAFRNRAILFPFRFPDEVVKKCEVTDDTPTQFMQLQQWQGRPCFLAYTDATYRFEPSHGCMRIQASELADHIRQHQENAPVVINPEGPATLQLEQSDLHALATEP